MTEDEQGAEMPGFRSAVGRRLVRLIPVALAAGFLILAVQIPIGTLNQPEPGMFPLVVAICLLAGALLMLREPHSADLETKDDDIEAEETIVGDSAWKVPVIAAVMVGYVVLTPLIGHLITAAVTSFVLLRLVSGIPAWRQAIIACCVSAGSYAVFALLLGVRLPVWGVLA